MLYFVIQYHPDRTLTDVRWKLVRAQISSALSVGASGKRVAVQPVTYIASRRTDTFHGRQPFSRGSRLAGFYKTELFQITAPVLCKCGGRQGTLGDRGP